MESQAQLWREGRRSALIISTHILGPGAEAEEVADEVITDLIFRYVHQLEHDAALEGYLRLMTVRRSLRRREKRGRTKPAEPMLAKLSSDAVPADEQLATLRSMPQLALCLEKLTPKARSMIRMRYGSELTQEKIGEVVGASKQYIGRVLKESLSVLRACLEKR